MISYDDYKPYIHDDFAIEQTIYPFSLTQKAQLKIASLLFCLHCIFYLYQTKAFKQNQQCHKQWLELILP